MNQLEILSVLVMMPFLLYCFGMAFHFIGWERLSRNLIILGTFCLGLFFTMLVIAVLIVYNQHG